MPELFPDLTEAQEVLESLMVDQGEVTRNPDGTEDGVTNETTGVVEEPADSQVYLGKMKIKVLQQHSDGREGGAPTYVSTYLCGLPAGSPEVLAGDHLRIISCARDPVLAGKKLLVTRPLFSTFHVQRKFEAELAQVGEVPRP